MSIAGAEMSPLRGVHHDSEQLSGVLAGVTSCRHNVQWKEVSKRTRSK